MSQNEYFKRSFALALKKAGDKADLVVRKSAQDVAAQLISRSPVDTGRFRANWRCSIGGPDTSTSSSTDRSGSSTLAAAVGTINAYKTGDTIWLLNSLPYARRLEDGWSKQAPGGMVRLTILSWRRAVNNAARELR